MNNQYTEQLAVMTTVIEMFQMEGGLSALAWCLLNGPTRTIEQLASRQVEPMPALAMASKTLLERYLQYHRIPQRRAECYRLGNDYLRRLVASAKSGFRRYSKSRKHNKYYKGAYNNIKCWGGFNSVMQYKSLLRFGSYSSTTIVAFIDAESRRLGVGRMVTEDGAGRGGSSLSGQKRKRDEHVVPQRMSPSLLHTVTTNFNSGGWVGPVGQVLVEAYEQLSPEQQADHDRKGLSDIEHRDAFRVCGNWYKMYVYCATCEYECTCVSD